VIGVHGEPEGRIARLIGNLIVVDPASPTTPVAVEPGGTWQMLAEFEEGDIDVGLNSVSNPQTRLFMYLKESRVHRLDLRRGAWPPAAAQVSTLTINGACQAAAIHDVRNAERSWIVFFPGAGLYCDTLDGHQWAVRADMAPDDPPVAVASEVVGAMRANDGAITGFVIRDGAWIRKVDSDFGNPIDLFTVVGGPFTHFPLENLDFPSSMQRGHLLFVESNELRAYDLTAGGGPFTLFTPGAGERCCSVVATDATGTYLTVEGNGSGRLLKVTDLLAVQVLTTESGSRILTVGVTPTRLVYSIVDASGVVYRSVPKSGGTPLTIAPAEPCPDLSSMVVAGENIWYDCSALGPWDYGGFLEPPRGLPDEPFVGFARSDGTGVQIFENAQIAGTVRANPMPLIPDSSTVHAVTVAHLGEQQAIQALRELDGSTASLQVEYAALPANLLLDPFWQSSTSGLPSLFTLGYIQGGLWAQRELFFFQTDVAGVTRVTTFAP
jgi:hypothetical protein